MTWTGKITQQKSNLLYSNLTYHNTTHDLRTCPVTVKMYNFLFIHPSTRYSSPVSAEPQVMIAAFHSSGLKILYYVHRMEVLCK